MVSSTDCAPCHEAEYKNWLGSRHRVAATNELYLEGFQAESSPWCTNCHAPFRSDSLAKQQVHTSEGISCLVCHVSGGEIISGNAEVANKKNKAHRYRLNPTLKTEEFCENCHEFNFPTAGTASKSGDELKFSHTAMQSTVSEYRSSFYYGRQTCVDCHVNAGTPLTHSFAGGHSRDLLRKTFEIDITRVHRNFIHIKIYASGVGHAFPTGDLFRTLRLELIDSKLGIAKEVLLRHDFRLATPDEVRKGSAAKVRIAQNVIGPPRFDHMSSREYDLEWPIKSNKVDAILKLHYADALGQLTSKIPQEKTEIVILNKKFLLTSFR